jgi:hypothetical protein
MFKIATIEIHLGYRRVPVVATVVTDVRCPLVAPTITLQQGMISTLERPYTPLCAAL